MRCLYCGKQLALFRRLTGSGEFCSDAHKQSYHEEYNRLALGRLLQAQQKSDELRTLTKQNLPLPPGRQRALPPPSSPLPALPPPASTIDNRWTEVRTQARAALPPPEPAPPDPAEFLFDKLHPLAAPIPITAETSTQPSLTQTFIVIQPCWNPTLAVEEDQPPSEAGALPSTLAAFASDFRPAANSVPPDSCPFIVGPILPKAAPKLSKPGFRMRPRIAIDPLRFIQTSSEPPEALAVPDFQPFQPPAAAPANEPAFEQLQALQIHALEPVLATEDAFTLQTDRPPERRPAGSEQRRPAAVKVKLAAMAAALPPALPSEIPTAKNGSSNQAEAPASQVIATTVRSAPVRRRTVQVPSILGAPDEESREGRSLWGALRKYIKG